LYVLLRHHASKSQPDLTVSQEQNAPVGWQSFNRKTGNLEREQQPLWKKLKLFLLFNPLTEWIDRTHLMRLYIHEESVAEGRRERSRESRRCIAAFVDAYEINMQDFDPSDTDFYATFEDFFTRAHRQGSRPIYDVTGCTYCTLPTSVAPMATNKTSPNSLGLYDNIVPSIACQMSTWLCKATGSTW